MPLDFDRLRSGLPPAVQAEVARVRDEHLPRYLHRRYYRTMKPEEFEAQMEERYGRRGLVPFVQEMAENAPQDAKNLLLGPIEIAKGLATQPGETLKAIPRGMLEYAREMVTDPLGTLKREPISTAAMFVSPGAALKGAKVAVRAGRDVRALRSMSRVRPRAGEIRGISQRLVKSLDEATEPIPVEDLSVLLRDPTAKGAQGVYNRFLNKYVYSPRRRAQGTLAYAMEEFRGRPAQVETMARLYTSKVMAHAFPDRKAAVVVPNNPAVWGSFAGRTMPMREVAFHYAHKLNSEGIDNRWGAFLTPEQRAAMQDFSKTGDALFQIGKKAGVIAEDATPLDWHFRRFIAGREVVENGKQKVYLYGNAKGGYNARGEWVGSAGAERRPFPSGGSGSLSRSGGYKKERVLPDPDEAMQQGYLYETLDPAETVIKHHREVIGNVAAKKFVEWGADQKMPDGNPWWVKGDPHPEDYRPLSTRQLEGQRPTAAPGDKSAAIFENVYSHPEVWADLESMVGAMQSGGWEAGWQQGLHAVKKLKLSGSMFHLMALTEEAFGMGFGPERFLTGLRAIREGDPILERVVRHGLSLDEIGSSPMESHVGIFREMGERSKLMRPVARLVEPWERMSDAVLWKNYHPGLKAYAAVHAYRGLERLSNGKGKLTKWHREVAGIRPRMTPDEIASRVADMVNDSFGGLSWHKMLTSKDTQRFMRTWMLAPDWTMSRLRIATGALPIWAQEGIYRMLEKTPLAKNVARAVANPTDPAARWLYRKYWMWMGAYSVLGVNGLNYLLSGIATGEPRFMWNNAEGHRDQLMLPYRGPDDQLLYLRVGKVVTEPLHWVGLLKEPAAKVGSISIPNVPHAAVETAWGKAHPMAHAILAAVTGRDFLNRPLVEKEETKGVQALQAARASASHVLPLPVEAGLEAAGFRSAGEFVPTALGLPVSRDYSRSAFVEDAVLALLGGDRQAYTEAVRRARENRIPLDRTTSALVKSGVTKGRKARTQRTLFERVERARP